MITIITGDIHQGKTKLMKELYDKLFKTIEDYDGDGFLAEKNIVDNQVIGYDYYRLGTKKRGVLARKSTKEIVAFEFGPYKFIKKGLEYVVKTMDELLEEDVDLFLDEIGPVELEGLGFSDLLTRMIHRGAYNGMADIYITVRRPFINAVISKFGIDDYRIIDVDHEKTRR